MLSEAQQKTLDRFMRLFKKDKNYYAFDYGTRFNPTKDPKTKKIKYTASPGDKFKPFWFVPRVADYRTYEIHLVQEKQHRVDLDCTEDNKVDMGIILPPCDLNGDSETKGLVHWGAIDEDVYNKPELQKKYFLNKQNRSGMKKRKDGARGMEY